MLFYEINKFEIMSNIYNKISTALTEKLSQEELKKIHRTINLLEICVMTFFTSASLMAATIIDKEFLNTLYIAVNAWKDYNWFLFRMLLFAILFLPMLIVFLISLKLRNINCYIYPQLDGKSISLLQLKIIQIIVVCTILVLWLTSL